MPLSKDYNPFANQDIHFPKAYLEDFRRYCRTQGADDPGKDSPEEVPFKRYIDFWSLAVALGAANKAYMPISSDQKHRFITGAVLQNDLQRIEYLMLLAIAHTENAYVVSEPRRVMDIAESYAAGGIQILLEMLKNGHMPALLNVTRSLFQQLESDTDA